MLCKFIEFVEANKLKVNSVIITVDGTKHKHIFRKDVRQDIRSISKVVSSLGIHKAIDSGLFGLDNYVMPFFRDVEITNRKNIEALEELKIKHLLSLSTGHERGLMLRKDMASLPAETDFVSYVLNSEIAHEPGTHFAYNNGATYLLSAIVQRLTGKPFDDWVFETVLKPLDMEKPQWERTEEGICLGATGLYLNNEEVHRIGLLLLNRGDHEGRQIINSQWIDSMHLPHIINSQFINSQYAKHENRKGGKLNKLAYGYHIWVCTDGSTLDPNTNYFCDGAKGQYLIVSPKKKMLITILSNQGNTELLDKILNENMAI